mgnify:CR=1 FL=1
MKYGETRFGASFFPKGAPFFPSGEKTLYFLILASVFIFILWPIAAVLFKSIFIQGQVDFSEYITLFRNKKYLLGNSILVSSLATFLSVVLGTCVALYLTHCRGKGKKLIFGVLLLSIISPPFVSSLVYIMLFGRRGLITCKILGLHLNPYGWHGIVLMQTAGFTAIAALLILGILHRVDRNLEFSAHDLGASTLTILRSVTLPLALPGILVAGVVVFIRSLSDFGTPIIIGGKFTVLATQAYLNVVGLYNMPRAAAMCMLLLLPALVAFVIYRRILGRFDYVGTGAQLETGRKRIRLSRSIEIFLALVTWGYITFEILKYGTIFAGAFTRTWGFDFTPTLVHLKTLSGTKLESFFRSLRYAFMAGAIGAVLGVIIAYLLERKKIAGGKALDFISDLPYIIPGSFFGIGYILAFHHPPLMITGTAFIVVVNCIYRQLPISIKSGTAVLKQCDPNFEAAARDLGAGEKNVIKDIVTPLMRPAVLIAFINTFTMTMITIGAIIFLVSPETKVATVDMFGEIKRGRIGAASVLANLIIVTVLAVNLLFSWLYVRKGKKDRD